MGHISALDRREETLIPEALDDYVGAENPVCVIDAYVDGVDLAGLGIDAKLEGTALYRAQTPAILPFGMGAISALRSKLWP